MTRWMVLLFALLLAACNLQQEPRPSPTAAPAGETPRFEANDTSQPRLLPTLQATPTQLTLTTVTPLPAPTTIDIQGSDGALPTVDAALADERYELQASANSTVGINYEVTLTSGTIMIVLQGPDGLIWQKIFTESAQGRDEIAVTHGGTYEILVTRERFDGNYALSWG